ncbi:MAG: hypothetical protein Q9163_005052 [Psora crenata]
MEGAPITNGVAGASYRKRRPSGAGPAPRAGPIDSFPQPPAAPEVPKGPPVSYRQPQTDETEYHPANGTSSSFAQRAAVLASSSYLSDHTKPESETQAAPAPAKRERRTSLNRPIGGVYSEIQKHRRDSYPSTTSPASPRRRSNPQGTFQPQIRNSISPTSRGASQNPQQTPPQKPVTDPRGPSASPSLAQPRKDSWAADRSPLQKLEVKLSDISKEEKRARVEEAERRLRDSRLVAGQPLQIANDVLPRRASAGNAATRSQQTAHDRDRDAKDSELRGLGRNQSRRTSRQTSGNQLTDRRHERGVRFHNTDVPDDAHSDADPNEEDTGYKRNSIKTATKRASQGRTIPSQRFRQDSPRMQTESEKVSLEQEKLYKSTAGHSRDVDQAPALRNPPDRALRPDVIDREQVPKDDITTQTAAGIQARQKVGFAGDRQVAELSAGRRHHLSDVLHNGPLRTAATTSVTETTPRYLDEWRHGGVARLTADDFLEDRTDYTPWWEKPGTTSRRQSQRASVGGQDASHDGTAPSLASFSPPLYLKCGPLLRYTGMRRDRLQTQGRSGPQSSERETWRGTVMIVTSDVESRYDPAPALRLFPEPMEKLPPPQPKAEAENGEDLPIHYLDPVAGLPKLSRTGKTVYVKPVDDLQHGKDLSRFETNDDGLFEDFRTAAVPTAYGTPEYRHGQTGPSPTQINRGRKAKKGQRVDGVRLHAERGVTFWRFNLEVELQPYEARIAYSINNGHAVGFWVPARGHTMNIIPDEFSGPDPLWRDVLNSHQTRPFHVMIGGGDQIYNDAVMRQSPLLRDWLDTKNPHRKHNAEFTPALQEELETFYLERYSMWFSQGLFGMANSQIPMVNMWDDHDIIDGFGSYPHHFMSTRVFSGLGAVAFKYYMLFQHQTVPNETSADEPSWLLGTSRGPYINEHSRSLYLSLGKNVAFLGLDCRTERMREEILSEASYDAVFERCRKEIFEGETKHLIVLLGVPIAYPRLVWLENLLTSRVLDPIKAIGRMGMLGGFLNRFDGGLEVLDDLDDHWTAKNHKQERNWFVRELQELAAEKGDVHLAAVGQFYSNPRLKIPKDRDHRYMVNIVSSAIVNTPPPEVMSDIVNKRNKTHHLDTDTDENMIPMFSHDVDGKARNNKHLLPRRNWCSIGEYLPGATPSPTPVPSEPGTPSDITPSPPTRLQRTLSLTRSDVKPGNLIRRLSGRSPSSSGYMASKEYGSSSPPHSPSTDGYFSPQPWNPSSTIPTIGDSIQRHSSAPLPRPANFLRRPTNMSEKAAVKGDPDDTSGHINLENGLDIVLHCEIDQGDPAGVTSPYRLLIPALFYESVGDQSIAQYRKQSLLQQFSSLRGRGTSKVANGQGQGNWGHLGPSDTESDSKLDETESLRPRRWSFGLEKRRRYRDQSPVRRPGSQEIYDTPHQTPSNEAQHLELFQQKPTEQQQPQAQRQFEDRNQQIGLSAEHEDEWDEPYEIPGPRQARKFEAFDDYEDDGSGDVGSSRDRVDSVDYHANIDTGKSAQNGSYQGERVSKVDQILGAGSGSRPVEVGGGDAYAGYGEEYDDDRIVQKPAGKRMSGYDGIEAYSEKEKKSWRRSLKFF